MNPQPPDYDDALENLNNAPAGSIIALKAIHYSNAQLRAAIRESGPRGRWAVTGIEHVFTPEDLLDAWTYEALR